MAEENGNAWSRTNAGSSLMRRILSRGRSDRRMRRRRLRALDVHHSVGADDDVRDLLAVDRFALPLPHRAPLLAGEARLRGAEDVLLGGERATALRRLEAEAR